MSKSPAKRIALQTKVRLAAYSIIEKAVEEGAQYGWHRIWKYHEGKGQPDVNVAVDHITRNVMNSLCEVLQFDDQEEQ